MSSDAFEFVYYGFDNNDAWDSFGNVSYMISHCWFKLIIRVF